MVYEYLVVRARSYSSYPHPLPNARKRKISNMEHVNEKSKFRSDSCTCDAENIQQDMARGPAELSICGTPCSQPLDGNNMHDAV